ncbi:unnamed protein product [Acanthoscelides obtectus]|uniref:DDE-1 domain-containing protein n=1 Tax=Acanthoscelides obtectus TaxID=200917 RepID=A0A9P0M483_ACAOB|nr:unnamed protein product [Acanthoscelides obtectus]CAK1647732.1 Pogo transposable element with KRAB domain [Acanthoscelides obtectus]
MKLAFEFAVSKSKKISESCSKNSMAGKDWFRGFLSRNPEISLRTPEATSLSRSTRFNRKNVNDFFQNLRIVREKFKFELQNIYNCDEVGCTTVQDCPKVLASKKAKQVGQVTSSERGTLVTVCFAVNAICVIPPFFIFPRIKYREDFVCDDPEGSNGDAYSTGWMTAGSFLKFMEHFKKYSNASPENPVLLIFDNHESHVSIEIVKFAKENGIALLTLPPHCSNKMQPLDVTVYSPLKVGYNAALSNWMISNPGKTVTIYNIPTFIKSIMSATFSQANILSGFRKCGIQPFNPDIFTAEDFLCSAVTDRDNSHGEVQLDFSGCLAEDSLAIPSTSGVTATGIKQTPPNQIAVNLENINENAPNEIPSSSAITEAEIVQTTPEKMAVSTTNISKDMPTNIFDNTPKNTPSKATSSSLITPEMIRPFPKAGPRKTTRRGRQPGKTKILTQSPEKDENYDNFQHKSPIEKTKQKIDILR